MTSIVSVVGNPRQRSRTAAVAAAVADRLSSGLGGEGGRRCELIELSELGGHLLEWGDPTARAAVDMVISADVLIAASPVFKATFTGLLKLLFDHVAQGQLVQTVAVPVMVGATPHHAMSVDVHLRPLLLELGACCPTSSVFVLESELESLDAQLDAWSAVAVPLVRGALQGCVRDEIV